ncbi:acyltransferase family protein [Promicromonospora kroppenstedtii]|uniref:acyltransferase family protein n=1 Tax=Promicromonospora kroppenstedtii TaxID=440482 RepID=UPI0004B9D564|nr:acyltransferase family protein [Promicromonospora kroppenstedtii]
MHASTTVGTADVPAPPTSDAERPEPRRRFLPEVQALRALAVALVVVYHLEPELLPGGYIGVDVFFVISGFLITGHMIREVEKTGRLSLGRFWAARARRILPAGLVVIGVTAALAPLVVPVTEWADLQRQALASVFYVQNWVLAADSVDYLAADNAPTAFQHFWSLAVEEQFYLLWPIVVVVGALLVRRVARDRVRALHGVLLVLFGLIVVASFVWSVQQVRAGDAAAYFATTTRLWELGAGGLLAVVLRHTSRFAAGRSLLALAGLATIIAGALVLTPKTPFPGFAALVPVLGAAAIIAAGRTSGAGSLTWLVDRSWVQWLGNVSYSVYLWHFPIIIGFEAWANRQPHALESIGLLALSLLMAHLSYTFVERPVRTARWAGRGNTRVLLAAATAMAVTAGVAVTPMFRAQVQEQEWQQEAQGVEVGLGSGFGAEAVDGGNVPAFVDKAGPVIVPNLQDVHKELSRTYAACAANATAGTTPRCEFGDPAGRRTLALVGDSHVRMFASPVVEAARERGWRVVTYLHNSCPFSLDAREMQYSKACLRANQETLDALVAEAPDLVVTGIFADSLFKGTVPGYEPGVGGLVKAWDALQAVGSRIVVIKDAPRPRADVLECVADHAQDPGSCAVSREKAFDYPGHKTLRDAARIAGVRIVDLTDRYCGPERCMPVVGNVMVYRDNNHVTDTYARSLQPYIAEGLWPKEGPVSGHTEATRDR